MTILFVFVCMLLIKGDGMDFATNAFTAVDSATVLTLLLSLLRKHLWEIIRGVILIKLKRDVGKNVVVSILGELHEQDLCVLKLF